MITMGTKALTRGIEQLDFLVVALCGVVLLLEGYDIAAIGYAVPSIADAGDWHRRVLPQRSWRAMSACCSDQSASEYLVIDWGASLCSLVA